MTLQDLHNISKFTELFADPRFVALLHYHREHIGKSHLDNAHTTEALIHRGGFRDGWLEAINEMPKLENPPKPEPEKRDGRLYSERPR